MPKHLPRTPLERTPCTSPLPWGWSTLPAVAPQQITSLIILSTVNTAGLRCLPPMPPSTITSLQRPRGPMSLARSVVPHLRISNSITPSTVNAMGLHCQPPMPRSVTTDLQRLRSPTPLSTTTRGFAQPPLSRDHPWWLEVYMTL